MTIGRPDPSTPRTTATPAQHSPTHSLTDSLTLPRVPDHELIRRIGGGSYGEVWLARNVMGTCRAVKIVYRQSFDHDRPFEREFNGIQKFEPISRSHEGLVDILHVGRSEGYFFYVMELADALGMANDEASPSAKDHRASSFVITSSFDIRHSSLYSPHTLGEEIKRRGRLPVAECLAIGQTLASALAHVHANNLVHRDVKPSNIIFVNGVPKLADIGLVADISEARSFVGTTGFIPPEGPGTPQADLYSLGKVLYEAGTGKDRHDFPQLPANLRELADHTELVELNEILLKACDADLGHRYQSAEDMLKDLESLQRGKSVRQKRVIERRFSIARKISFVALPAALLIAALPLTMPVKNRKTPNLEALRLYELGRWHYNKLTDEDRRKAIEYLSRAIRIQPTYADAYRLLFELHTWDPDGPEKLKICKELAAKLMAIDPTLAEGHTALSWAKYLEGDWGRAEEEIQKATKLNTNYATAHGIYGYYLSLLGRWEEALPQLQRAQELDPTSRLVTTVAGFPFLVARRYDQAIAQFQKALDLDKSFPLARWWIARTMEGKGDYVGALDEYETLDRLTGADEAQMAREYGALRQAFHDSSVRGYWLKVQQMQQDQTTLLNRRTASQQDVRYDTGIIHAQLGEKQKALDWLEMDYEQSHAGSWLKLEPLYAPLYEEPRFKTLLKKAGLEK